MSLNRVLTTNGQIGVTRRATHWTPHAIQRLGERGFSRECVRQALRQPFAAGVARDGAYWTVARVICAQRWRWIYVVWLPVGRGAVSVVTIYQPTRLREGAVQGCDLSELGDAA